MKPLLPAGTLEIVAGTPAAVRNLVSGLPADLATWRPGSEWSIRDVVAHMLSVEGPAFRERIELIAAGGHPAVPNVDEEEALRASGFAARPLPWLLDELERRRMDDVARFRSLPDLSRAGIHSVVGEVTVANVLSHLAYHDTLHIAQVAGILAAHATGGRGNMGLLDGPAPA